jgi:hypothetical protein
VQKADTPLDKMSLCVLSWKVNGTSISPTGAAVEDIRHRRLLCEGLLPTNTRHSLQVPFVGETAECKKSLILRTTIQKYFGLSPPVEGKEDAK